MSDLDLTPLRSVLAEFVSQGSNGLLPALHAAQAIYGWLPEPVAAEVSRALGVPLADVHGVIEFYAMFYNEPVGQTIVRVCTDPVCALRGADAVLEGACRKAKVSRPGETSADRAFTIERSPCLGLCNTGVSVNITQSTSQPARTFSVTQVTPDTLDDLFAGRGRPADDLVAGDSSIVTALCGRGHAAALVEYEAAGGMRAMRSIAEKHATPQQLIDEL